jgi:hypothetical protein
MELGNMGYEYLLQKRRWLEGQLRRAPPEPEYSALNWELSRVNERVFGFSGAQGTRRLNPATSIFKSGH